MKKGLIIGLAAAAVAAAVASLVSGGVSAGPLREPVARADDGAAQTKPAHEIAAGVRAAGLDPDGAPVLRGRYYVVRALDRYGREMRVLADAQFGDILSIVSARRAGRYQTSYNGGPRIIHVPQPDDAIAAGDYRDRVDRDDASHVEDVADPEPPKPVRPARPARGERSAAPSPVKRHIVNSAPQSPRAAADKHKDKSLSPIYPTPDFGAKADSGKKFDPPRRRN